MSSFCFKFPVVSFPLLCHSLSYFLLSTFILSSFPCPLSSSSFFLRSFPLPIYLLPKVHLPHFLSPSPTHKHFFLSLSLSTVLAAFGMKSLWSIICCCVSGCTVVGELTDQEDDKNLPQLKWKPHKGDNIPQDEWPQVSLLHTRGFTTRLHSLPLMD